MPLFQFLGHLIPLHRVVVVCVGAQLLGEYFTFLIPITVGREVLAFVGEVIRFKSDGRPHNHRVYLQHLTGDAVHLLVGRIHILLDFVGVVLHCCLHGNEHLIDVLFSIFQRTRCPQLLLTQDAVTHEKINDKGCGQQNNRRSQDDPYTETCGKRSNTPKFVFHLRLESVYFFAKVEFFFEKQKKKEEYL